MSFWTTPVNVRDDDAPPRFALLAGRVLVTVGALLCLLPFGGALVYLLDGTAAQVFAELVSPPAVLGFALLLVGLLTLGVGHLHVLAWRATRDD